MAFPDIPSLTWMTSPPHLQLVDFAVQLDQLALPTPHHFPQSLHVLGQIADDRLPLPISQHSSGHSASLLPCPGQRWLDCPIFCLDIYDVRSSNRVIPFRRRCSSAAVRWRFAYARDSLATGIRRRSTRRIRDLSKRENKRSGPLNKRAPLRAFSAYQQSQPKLKSATNRQFSLIRTNNNFISSVTQLMYLEYNVRASILCELRMASLTVKVLY